MTQLGWLEQYLAQGYKVAWLKINPGTFDFQTLTTWQCYLIVYTLSDTHTHTYTHARAHARTHTHTRTHTVHMHAVTF